MAQQTVNSCKNLTKSLLVTTNTCEVTQDRTTGDPKSHPTNHNGGI